MSKIYVVMQRSYEYNDETYRAEDGGNIVVGYSTEVEAQRVANEKNMNTFREHRGYMYLGYESYENFRETYELNEFLASLGNTEDDSREYSYEDLGDYYHFEAIMSYLSNATDDEVMIFVNALVNPEYYVEEVEVAS